MLRRWLSIYYLATPLMWAVDIVWGLNLRTAGFASLPILKHIYYSLCCACGLALWYKPAWAPLVGAAESTVNILSLILGVLGPYYQFLGNVGASDAAPIHNPLSVNVVVNFVLAGSMACLSFYGGQKHWVGSVDSIHRNPLS